MLCSITKTKHTPPYYLLTYKWRCHFVLRTERKMFHSIIDAIRSTINASTIWHSQLFHCSLCLWGVLFFPLNFTLFHFFKFKIAITIGHRTDCIHSFRTIVDFCRFATKINCKIVTSYRTKRKTLSVGCIVSGRTCPTVSITDLYISFNQLFTEFWCQTKIKYWK